MWRVGLRFELKETDGQHSDDGWTRQEGLAEPMRTVSRMVNGPPGRLAGAVEIWRLSIMGEPP
jgi:hypothetical protein